MNKKKLFIVVVSWRLGGGQVGLKENLAGKRHPAAAAQSSVDGSNPNELAPGLVDSTLLRRNERLLTTSM